MIRRNRPAPEPASHPDPVIDRELRRIRQLRDRCAAKKSQAGDYQHAIRETLDSISDAHRRVRDSAYSTMWDDVVDSVTSQEAQVAALQQAIRDLEADVDRLHDEIADREGKLCPSDLAYL